jgi:hypothetical protein
MSTPQTVLFPAMESPSPVANDQGRDDGPGAAGTIDMDGILADLRTSVDQLTSDIARVTARTALAATDAISDGADGLRTEIRNAPGISLAVAVTAGVLLAIAVAPSRRDSRTWADVARGPTRDDVDAMLSRARMAARDTQEAASSTASSMASNIERLAQYVSQMDARSTLAPAVERGSELLRTAWRTFSGQRAQ